MAYGYEIFLKDGVSAVAGNIARSFNTMTQLAGGAHVVLQGRVGAVAHGLNTVSQSVRSVNQTILDTVVGVRNQVIRIGVNPDSALQGIQTIVDAASEAFSEIEKKQALLSNTYQSATASKLLLADIRDFAAAHKIAIKEVEDGYVSLATRGFAPTMSELQKMADFAATKGGLVQLVDAMTEAETMKFEKLRTFGVQIEKSGDGVAATFRGVTTQIGANAAEIRKYIIDIGDLTGIQGAADAVASTASGTLVALKNRFELWLRDLGSYSLVSIMQITTGVWHGFMLLQSVPAAFALIDVFVAATTIKLTALWAWTWRTTFAFGGMVVKGLWSFVLMAQSVGVYMVSLAGTTLSLLGATTAQIGLNIAMSANPVGLIVLGVAALAVAFVGLFKLIDTLFPNFFKGVAEWFGKAFQFINEWFIQPIKAFFSWLFESAIPQVGAGADGDAYEKWKKDPQNEGKSLYDFLNLTKKEGVEGKGDEDDKKKKKSHISDKIENSGHGGIRNITINIGKLVEQMHFHTNNMTESADKIKEQVIRLLLDATNQVNYQ
jgi:hypothetical protein